MEGLDLGAIYDEFLESGGFAFGNPTIGSTSWSFVQDNNVNDVQLTVQGLATTACFIRLARIDGCDTFSGIAGPVSIDGSACVDCNFIFDGGAISAGDCNDSGSFIIQNAASPNAGNTAVESIWLMSTIGNCDQASGELSPFNVGELYDLFLAAGGFGVADPNIGGTSWQFVTDLDGDDLTLVVNEMEGEACFTRCSRIEGCERLMGESNFVSVSCVSTANDPVAVELCENILTVDGMDIESVYFVKVYNNEFTQIIYESNSYENNYTDLDEISLPDGNFILDVMLLEEDFEEEFRMTKKFSCPAECVDPLEENTPSSITTDGDRVNFTALLPHNEELKDKQYNSAFKIFPNPASDFVRFTSPAFKAKFIEVRLVNMLGQLTKTASFETHATQEFLDMEVQDLENGMYFVSFRIDGMLEEAGTLVISQKK
ncbi:MAG: T9SS type A sorting domain-containing protein [Bacteroidota bacterium]